MAGVADLCKTGQMWSLAHAGPSQYSTFMATLNGENTEETVGSRTSKLRNSESTVHGPVQAPLPTVVKSQREEC